MSSYGADGSNDRKDRKENEKKKALESEKDKNPNPNQSNPVVHGSNSKGTYYGHADGTVHQTTGGHRSSTHPTTSATKCRVCGAVIAKSLTVCNGCRK